MEDTLTPTPVTSETVTTPAPVAVVATPTPNETPQQSSRKEVYEKYYAQHNPTPAPTPVAETVVDVVADGTGGDVQPAAQAEPLPPTPPAPDANALLLAELSEMRRELAALKQPTQPVAPVVQTAPDAPIEDLFITLMQEGKPQEAIAALRAQIARDVAAENKIEVTREVEERLHTQNRIKTFVDNLRSENPDLLPLEGMISAQAHLRLQAAQQNHIYSGKPWTMADLEREYISAVNVEMANAKSIVQQLRGAGRQEAQVTQQRVLTSTVLAPNPVTSHRPDSPPSAPAPESTQDYLAKRDARNWAGRGIANNNN
jgi:hypothetical protein